MIHGGVSSWYGQITTIIPNQTFTLKEMIGGTETVTGEIPVFSPVVAMIASLQVIEGFKVMLNRGDTLENKLLMIDLNDYSLNEVEM